MKHNNFVSAVAIALFVTSSVAIARVEAEYSGNDYYQANSGAVWGEPAASETSPVEVQGAQPTSLQNTAMQNTSTPPPAMIARKSEVAYVIGDEVGGENQLVAKQPDKSKPSMRIIPMGGAGDYVGAWGINTKNNYSFGIATEFLTDSPVAIELEGGYANYSLAYTSLAEPSTGYLGARLMSHNFDQFNLGANAKFYMSQGTIRPYFGAGLHGVYYAGMQQRLPGDFIRQYDEIVGSGQLLVGADVTIAKQTSLGLRGSWMIPVLDKPVTRDSGDHAAPGFEEAGLIGASYYKILGTVSVDL